MLLTFNQITTIIQILTSDDIYLKIDSKDDEDVSIIKVIFFNYDDEESQPHYIDDDGNQVGEENYGK